MLTLLNLPDDGTYGITKVEAIDSIKYVHIERPPKPTYCPNCQARMHSKGIYVRTVNCPILQDTTRLILKVHERGWQCTNKECNHYMNETYPFLLPGSQSTDLTFFYVCEAMKDLNRTTASVAKQFNMSDTQVHDIFSAHVDLEALPLPEIISVDEVYMNINNRRKYAFVIMDFVTGEIIDIVEDRWKDTLERYFLSKTIEERKNVKYIISDAYKPYLDFPKEYFPNSISIIDSFHVVKYLITQLNSYIHSVMKKYRERDMKELEAKNHDTNRDCKTIKDSREVHLLKNYRWVLLKNMDEINYSYKIYYNKGLQMNVDTFRIEEMFLNLDKNFRELRELKEKYIDFNSGTYATNDEVKNKLDELIKEYRASSQSIFVDFALLLKRYKKQIIASFTTVQVQRKPKSEIIENYARLSNGPMESFNRKPKDYKRNARGSSNFHYTRNRILWATRRNPKYLSTPKTRKQIHSYSGKKRGSYNKNK
ncbi:MAG: ISL3 family transposase [Holdemanella sp.]|nr:ISL3 family transposase [Holdemanella sp.]